jgi:hypothetical protein
VTRQGKSSSSGVGGTNLDAELSDAANAIKQLAQHCRSCFEFGQCLPQSPDCPPGVITAQQLDCAVRGRDARKDSGVAAISEPSARLNKPFVRIDL